MRLKQLPGTLRTLEPNWAGFAHGPKAAFWSGGDERRRGASEVREQPLEHSASLWGSLRREDLTRPSTLPPRRSGEGGGGIGSGGDVNGVDVHVLLKPGHYDGLYPLGEDGE